MVQMILRESACSNASTGRIKQFCFGNRNMPDSQQQQRLQGLHHLQKSKPQTIRLFVEGPEEQSRHLSPQDYAFETNKTWISSINPLVWHLKLHMQVEIAKEISTWGRKGWRWTTWHFSHVTGFEFCMCTHPENRIANACKLDIHLQTHACIQI